MTEATKVVGRQVERRRARHRHRATCFCFVPDRRRRREAWLQVLVVPLDVSVQPIALVARGRDAVVLARVDHQLRVDAKALERLVHLLAAGDGHVEVVLPAHEQRRRLDAIGLEERVAHLGPGVRVLPRLAHLGVVLQDVLVRSVHRHLQGAAGAGGRGLEARVGGNRVVGEDAAVAPAADAQSIGIGDAGRDRPVHSGQQIDDLEVAPVGVDGLLVLRAAPGSATVVHLQHGVAVGRQDLADLVEAVVVLSVGSAVNPEDQRELAGGGPLAVW